MRLSLNRQVGSSPLTRGARKGRRLEPGRVGLIPAYAGSTLAEQE